MSTEVLLRRRRVLFPATSSSPSPPMSDDFLSDMSPLHFSSDSEDEDQVRMIRNKVHRFTLEQTLTDLESTCDEFQSSSFQLENYCCSAGSSGSKSHTPTILQTVSPSECLKTPLEDLLNCSDVNENNSDKNSLNHVVPIRRHRKSEPPPPNSDSPTSNCVYVKKCPKVRTTLFPEIIPHTALPIEMNSTASPKSSKTPISLRNTAFLCGSRHRGRRSAKGEINKGVFHRIKKPKNRSGVTKRQLALKAAMNIIDRSPLNDFLKENLPTTQSPLVRPPSQALLANNIIVPPPLPPPIPKIQQQNEDLPIDSTNKTNLCDMTSNLALHSPKEKPKKPLFSIFYTAGNDPNEDNIGNGTNKKQKRKQNTNSPKAANEMKKFRKITEDQLILDVGQKHLGNTECPQCKAVYQMGDPDDELMHFEYHNGTNILRFTGWKHERILRSNLKDDGKILHILENDPKPWWKKIKQILDFISKDMHMAYCPMDFKPRSQIYLYIRQKTIVGLLGAEPQSWAHRYTSKAIDKVQENEFPIKCGISILWVNRTCRHQGIATTLLNHMKSSFSLGHFLKNDEIAFSSATDDGIAFAQYYFNTANFLTYV